jgi:hypothetical protein
MTETFIRIAAGHYRNVGTGVEIVRVSADEAGQRGWHVTTPTVSGFEVVAIGATMREVKDAYVKAVREAYAAIEQSREEAIAVDRLRVADMAADASMAVVRDNDHAEALAYDEEWVRGMEKSGDSKMHNSPGEVDAAHGEALAIDAERTDFLAEQGDTEEDDLIHFWMGDRSPSACGVNISTTPYTYGSPVLAEVTCDECKSREQHRQTNAQAAQQAADELHAEALLMDGERTAARSSVFAAVRMVARRAAASPEQRAAADEAWTRGFGAPLHDPDPTPASHREALAGFREHGEPVWFVGRTWTVEHVVTGEGGRTCLTLAEVGDDAGRERANVQNVYADDVLADSHDEALHELAKRDAARTIAASRGECTKAHGWSAPRVFESEPIELNPEGYDEFERCGKAAGDSAHISASIPEVPADLDDDAAWATYCTALPPATDQQIADVLAEYGDPYAALRAEAVEAFKLAARSIWKIRAHAPRDQMTELHAGLIVNVRSQMRTLRVVVETYDMLTESWRLSTRTGADRDAATQTF